MTRICPLAGPNEAMAREAQMEVWSQAPLGFPAAGDGASGGWWRPGTESANARSDVRCSSATKGEVCS